MLKVSTSGANGGGEILIGGNYLGKGPEPNASATVILEGAEITADALNSGDGGRVIVWSDDYTNFAGSITALGSDYGKEVSLRPQVKLIYKPSEV